MVTTVVVLPYWSKKGLFVSNYSYISDFLNRTGLPADSTGVKAEGVRFKLPNLKKIYSIVLKTDFSSSEADSVIDIELYDVTQGSVIDSISGNSASDEEKVLDISSINDGDELMLRANVTTASSTGGATFDISYALLIIKYKD